MSMYYVAGEYLNEVGHAASIVASSEDANFPLEPTDISVPVLADDNPGRIFRWGSNFEQTVIIDTEVAQGGGFETGALEPYFSNTSFGSGSPAVSVTNTNPATGIYSAEFVPGASGGTAQMTKSWTLRNKRRFRLTLKFDINAGATIKALFYNNRAGRYLDSSGNWTRTPSACFTKTADTGSFETFSLDFLTDDMPGDETGLYDLFINATGNFTSWCDDISLRPAINFASVHGHNLFNGAEIRSSTDNFIANDVLQATLTYQPYRMWVKFTEQYIRYWQIKTIGINTSGPWMGQWIMTDVNTITRNFQDGYEVQRIEAQVRNTSAAGRQLVKTVSGGPRLVISMPFKHVDSSGLDETEVRDDIVTRSRYGKNPALVVPDSDLTDVVLFGTVAQDWKLKYKFKTVREGNLVLEEFALPRVG